MLKQTKRVRTKRQGVRLTEEEARRLGIISGSGKASKYHARKVTVDGVKFDSQLEADYYCELKLRQRAGEIDGFSRQARFVLTYGDDQTRATEYVCDFVVFYPDGHYEIIDCKGMKTDIFKLKEKMFKAKYPKLKLKLEKR